MTPGVGGRLVSSWFVDELLATTVAARSAEPTRPDAFRQFGRWWTRASRALGPASSLRSILDTAGAPLAELLGFSIGTLTVLDQPPVLVAALASATIPGLLVISNWQADLAATWRAARVRIQSPTRWALCFNGTALRLLDAERPYATRFLEIDLETAAHDERTFAVLWALLRARALDGPIDAAIETSTRHGVGVCRSLREGVLEALQELLHALLAASARRNRRSRRPPPPLDEAFEQSLTIVYRILFLLFAEARGLVPTWQPAYRDAYTIETLRDLAEGTGSARGLWESLQAIARLAAAGCRVGDLVVTAFNGRLFSPSRTPLGERLALDDERVRCAMRALSSRPGAAGRERIAYRDLDVEQLGAVYESVLDYVPAAATTGSAGQAPFAPAVRLDRTGTRRKATGSFYTPRSITDYLVRRTLAPLVQGRSPDRILSLRIVDPAMGSGAFLVAACRYLARQYESALVESGDCSPGDIGAGERSQFRRLVAQRCLYGVDANPTAVQLARLSLWLATLAADRPLTFLDHHLAVGDSLIGASLDDLARQPPGGHRRTARLPLFEADPAFEAIREALPIRQELASIPDDSAEIVRHKERTLEQLTDARGRLAQSKLAADLWCAAWFLPAKETPRPALFAELAAAAFDKRTTLSSDALKTWLDRLRAIAARHRFFHWTLEFPEVFFSPGGEQLASLGFDAVLGNPPWDVLRADGGADQRTMLQHQLRFVRGSGLYHARAEGHTNLYQLFVERALMLLRDGGRLGLVLPSGLFSDIGSTPLRSMLLTRCGIDSVIGMDNRDAIFPIHRSTRFLLLTATSRAPTGTIACRFGETDPSQLDAIAETAGTADRTAYPIALTPAAIARVGGRSGAIPLPRRAIDLAIMEKLTTSFPPLGDAAGWHVRFGRELNATEDRPHFGESGPGLPIVEGKQISPFAVDVSRSTHRIARAVARRLPHLRATLGRERLAYRDVAAPGNRLTLIAAMLPADCVTTHTVFCLKTPLDAEAQAFLCGLLNSLVLNYLVRQRVTTHVTTAIVHELPVARPARESGTFRAVVRLAAELIASPGAAETLVELQARVARLYALTPEELEHILSTFPLLDADYRRAIREAFPTAQ